MTPAGPDSSDRILIVEDDAAQRVGLQQLLRSWGFTVDVAAMDGTRLEKVAADPADDRALGPRHAAHGRPRSAASAQAAARTTTSPSC